MSHMDETTPPLVADITHLPPKGTIVKHYANGELYRTLFTVSRFPAAWDAGHKAAIEREGQEVMKARVSTNREGSPYREVTIFALDGQLLSTLDYGAVAYVSLKTGTAYIRDEAEFWGGVPTTVKDFNGDVIELPRFTVVNP